MTGILCGDLEIQNFNVTLKLQFRMDTIRQIIALLRKMETKSWKKIKDSVYGEIGTERKDGVERDFESFKIGLLLRNAREQKNLTQEQLGTIINKKRSYISRVENDGSNMTMKTLYNIVEKGLGGKVKISIDI
jgi:ribosome-binding protein aMBF1 (putative translation factor)